MSRALTLLLTLGLIACSDAADKPAKKASKPKLDDVATKASEGHDWADWIEPNFPFFSSVLDARDVGEGFPKDNLTPRGIILNLGHNLWACFDTDLLRISCIWQGEEGQPPVTQNALAPGSYHVAGQKTKDGQDDLPKPIGKVWLANGIYPGWQVADKPALSDPRSPAPSKEEIGRGALADGKFTAIRLGKAVLPKSDFHLGTIQLQYSLAGTDILELWYVITASTVGSPPVYDVQREIRIQPHAKPFELVLGHLTEGFHISALQIDSLDSSKSKSVPLVTAEGISSLQIGASDLEVLLRIDHSASAARSEGADITGTPPWPQLLTTKATLGTPKPTDAYVLDDIPLPLDNPWKRNLRVADITFLDDKGHAAAVTFDGDVWLLSGLTGDLTEVKWKRFASGLHEPMSIASRPSRNTENGAPANDLFVFDRNGIIKLLDTNNDQEVDVYQMFCNDFGQTAETREFPNSMKLAPDGSFVLSKGGQEGTTFGKDNGKVLRVSADGKTVTPLGYGLRQPFIGVHPKTGLVTASDQQGNYVPSTPIHIIKDNQFYGHLPTIAPKEQYPAPIAEPVTWIPHPVNPSGVTQTWLVDAKMGPLNDECIHIGYNRPELFRVLFNERFQRPQATVMSFWRDFDLAPLNASVNPADGQLYVTGFQVWGTTAKKISGLSRIRYTGVPRVLLKECTPTDKGILLRFTHPLDPKIATDPASYSAERWNYKRTPEYGSPHLKLDGSTGQEWLTPSSAYLSKDGKTVLIGIPDMKAGVHQMRIGWGLKSVDGLKAENTAYFSPWDLLTFDPVKEGFENITVDLTPRKTVAAAATKPTVEEGQRLYQMIGCMACHSIDGTTVGKVGPSWKGLFGSVREIGKGDVGKVNADEVYLKESILNPSAKVVKGFEKFDAGMPIYAGILNDSQIESLILYIKSLK